MYFRVNLKMKKPRLCCCFTWIVFIELNFTVAFLLIRKTWNDWFVGKVSDIASIFLVAPVEWPWSIIKEVSDAIMQLGGLGCMLGKAPGSFGLFALPRPRNGLLRDIKTSILLIENPVRTIPKLVLKQPYYPWILLLCILQNPKVMFDFSV